MSKTINLKNNKNQIDFIKSVKNGAIFAYPTEAVYGLGCDINNKDAIQKILDIKKRDVSKGLIVISDNLEKVRGLIDDNYYKTFSELNNDVSHTTWLCPASRLVLPEVTGFSKKIAVRITRHKVSCEICKLLDFPIISTSANRVGDEPIVNFKRIKQYFDNEVDYIIEGELGSSSKPSRILDLLTKEVLRAGD